MSANHTWQLVNVPDEFDSRHNELKIIDGSADSLNHPQGPITLATVNVQWCAPHVHHAEKIAHMMLASPELLAALENMVAIEDARFWVDDSHGLRDGVELTDLTAARAAIQKAKGLAI